MSRIRVVTSIATVLVFASLPVSAQFGGFKKLVNAGKEAMSKSAPSESAGRGMADGPSAFPDPVAEAEAFVVPSSIRVSAGRINCYQPKPGGDCKGTAWYPVIKFNLVGPIKKSSKVWVHFDIAGKPWFKKDFPAVELQAGRAEPMDSNGNVNDSWARLHTGLVGFKITAEDALAGTSRVLYQGTFKVGKLHTGNDSPNFKDQYEWYVDYDWALPVTHLDFKRDGMDQGFPPLEAHFTFKDPYECSQEYSAHLFHKGQEIDRADGRVGWSTETKNPDKQIRHGWSQVSFFFTKAVAHARPTTGSVSFDGAYVMAKHPGEYEIKVLRGGELARIARFKILPNGKLDNSLNVNNGWSGQWTLIASKVLGQTDGALNPEAWKKEGAWGQPLKGFALPE